MFFIFLSFYVYFQNVRLTLVFRTLCVQSGTHKNSVRKVYCRLFLFCEVILNIILKEIVFTHTCLMSIISLYELLIYK